jgi:hypothetical protein
VPHLEQKKSNAQKWVRPDQPSSNAALGAFCGWLIFDRRQILFHLEQKKSKAQKWVRPDQPSSNVALGAFCGRLIFDRRQILFHLEQKKSNAQKWVQPDQSPLQMRRWARFAGGLGSGEK